MPRNLTVRVQFVLKCRGISPMLAFSHIPMAEVAKWENMGTKSLSVLYGRENYNGYLFLDDYRRYCSEVENLKTGIRNRLEEGLFSLTELQDLSKLINEMYDSLPDGF